MAEKQLERIYTIPLAKAYDLPRNRRGKRAVNIVRDYLSKHMKVDSKDVSISEFINMRIWRDGIKKPPRKVKVKAVKEGEKVNAILVGEEELVKAREEKQKKKEEEKKPKEKPKEKKEEKKQEKSKQPEKKQEEEKDKKKEEGKADEKQQEKIGNKKPADESKGQKSKEKPAEKKEEK